jgi:hypothetical protein
MRDVISAHRPIPGNGSFEHAPIQEQVRKGASKARPRFSDGGGVAPFLTCSVQWHSFQTNRPISLGFFRFSDGGGVAPFLTCSVQWHSFQTNQPISLGFFHKTQCTAE